MEQSLLKQPRHDLLCKSASAEAKSILILMKRLDHIFFCSSGIKLKPFPFFQMTSSVPVINKEKV